MGHLVSIRSEDENRFVSKLWNSATGGMVAVSDYTYWIGLTDGETEGTWLWSDDDRVDYTIWHAGQPDNAGTTLNEDCVHLWNRATANVTWNDLSCSRKLFYVCELPQNRQ
ncbi:alpha-N-acetylgalactosamine-specific lectin-like [Antedon mediterranea]|uniref:alpha-N-acetylgalactosamine-specific lectin-like n=1 Tax=Antedon mediterranea TaxID=105859 RepID=UPI003AF43375